MSTYGNDIPGCLTLNIEKKAVSKLIESIQKRSP